MEVEVSKTLISPDDFASAGLAALWSILNVSCDEGWDYQVDIWHGMVYIRLETQPGRKKIEWFNDVFRVFRVCHDALGVGVKVFIQVHDGSGQVAGPGLATYTFDSHHG